MHKDYKNKISADTRGSRLPCPVGLGMSPGSRVLCLTAPFGLCTGRLVPERSWFDDSLAGICLARNCNSYCACA